jgi:hypothetical protein
MRFLSNELFHFRFAPTRVCVCECVLASYHVAPWEKSPILYAQRWEKLIIQFRVYLKVPFYINDLILCIHATTATYWMLCWASPSSVSRDAILFYFSFLYFGGREQHWRRKNIIKMKFVFWIFTKIFLPSFAFIQFFAFLLLKNSCLVARGRKLFLFKKGAIYFLTKNLRVVRNQYIDTHLQQSYHHDR